MDNIIQHVTGITPILTDSANLWINILLATVTFLAVLVALFQEKIRKLWNRAVLDMEINLIPPDSHQISLSNQNGQIVGQSIYIRIKVKHKRGSAGENVEIIPINFWKVDIQGKLSNLKFFLPINLVWSHFQPRTNLMRIPVGLFRYCDFGHFVSSPSSQKSILILDTMVQPNTVAQGEIPNMIRPGRYQFELLLSGDNVKLLKKKWEIEFDKWSDNENQMLNDLIKIKELT